MITELRPIVSIIVPFYNSEEFINRCINSILKQEFSNFELLLIDDGSTDSSRDICERYATLDNRIRTFTKANGGAGSARNLGLSKVRGEFCCFIDSDDFVNSQYLSGMLDEIRDTSVDLVFQNITFNTDSGIQHSKVQEGIISSRDYYELFIVREVHKFGFTVAKLYRIAIIRKWGLAFPENYSIAEDLTFFLRYLSVANVIAFQSISNYQYINRTDSLTVSLKSTEEYFLRYKDLRNLLEVGYSPVFNSIQEGRMEYESLQKSLCSILYMGIKSDFLEGGNGRKLESYLVNNFDRRLLINGAKYFRNPLARLGLILAGRKYVGISRVLFRVLFFKKSF